MYLFDTDKFVITEFCKLSTKSDVAVYTEAFSTFLIEIRIRQTYSIITILQVVKTDKQLDPRAEFFIPKLWLTVFSAEIRLAEFLSADTRLEIRQIACDVFLLTLWAYIVNTCHL